MLWTPFGDGCRKSWPGNPSTWFAAVLALAGRSLARVETLLVLGMVGALPVCPDFQSIGVRFLIPFTFLTSVGHCLLGLRSKSQPASVGSGSKEVSFPELAGLLHSAGSTGLLLGPQYSAGGTGLSPAGCSGPLV